MDASAFIAQQTLTAAVPLLLAGTGELVAERTGTINIGIEGLMLTGCAAGYITLAVTGSGTLALGAAVLAGVLLAGLFALVCVWWRADQIVTGTALNLLAMGLTATAWMAVQNHLTTTASLSPFTRIAIPGLSELPWVGPVLFQHYALTYFLALLLLVVWFKLRYTRAGLILRALGDSPDACAAAGVNARLWRTGALLFAGACAGAAGAYLATMRTLSFSPDMTGGQGFLVLALVIFGRWSLGGLIAGALLFGALDALQQYFQGMPLARQIPYQAFKMLPYLVTLLALALLKSKHGGPAKLGTPWPEDRD